MKINENQKNKNKKPRKPDSMLFRAFRRDHLRFRIICGPVWGSFAFWGSFAVGDYLRSEIIYGAVHVCIKT